MRLAISNIAWPADREAEAAGVLTRLGVDGVEAAPTEVWAHPLEASEAEARAYRGFWERRGLPIVALQALLFEKPALRLFADAAQRAEALGYLEGVIRLAGWLGATVLVFGSPKNRSRGALPPAAALDAAVPLFRRLGRVARDRGAVFCIEPNPAAYGCDFITRAAEGLELVRRVDDPGFGLHLDAAGMVLAGDAPAEAFSQALPHWRHFHVSEPFLGLVGRGGMDHRPVASALRASGYAQWVSIEMKTPEQGFDFADVERAVAFVRSEYAGEGTNHLGPGPPDAPKSAPP